MPNHCSNDLRIHGSPEDIKAFFNAVESPGKIIDADKIIPYPKKFKDRDEEVKEQNEEALKTGRGPFLKDGYNSGGYEWCIKNWGTKWGLYDFSKNVIYKKSALVSFSTAWSPPIPLVKKMSELFPTLKFTLRYYESGSAYKGMLKVKNKIVYDDIEEEYSGSRGG